MNRRLFWLFSFAVLILMIACNIATTNLSPTGTADIRNNQGSGGNESSNSISGTVTPSTTPTITPTSTATITPSPTPTMTPTPTSPAAGPYVVKQIQTLGGETISGFVCSVTLPFLVNVATPKITFNFNFVPANALGGAWTYAYTISGAGESHDAKGTYTLTIPKPDGSLLLTLTGRDHVVFHGFDGNIPTRYKFGLLPGAVPGCPSAQ